MKILKSISVILIATLITLPFVPSMKAETKTTNGITYNDSVYTKCKFTSVRKIYTKNADKKVIGVLSCKIGRLRNKEKVTSKTYEDVIALKMIMEPKKNPSKKVYGVSEYLKCGISLPSDDVNLWAPKNVAPKDNWTFGINFGKDSEGYSTSVSASTTVVSKRLDFEADVRPSKKKAFFTYDYKPYKNLSWSKTKNKYFRNTSDQYCMISVNTKAYSSIKFDFNSNFTYADDSNARPLNVHFGSIKNSSSFTWKL